MTRRCSIPFCLLLGGSGCVTTLPTYPRSDGDHALRILAARSRSVETLESSCRLLLARADGDEIQLSGAIAARMPDYLRLRAWKISQPVFDLTLTPDGLWVFEAGNPQDSSNPVFGDLTARRLTEAWSLATNRIDEEGWSITGETDATRFHLVKSVEGPGVSVIADVDRRTLTIRQYRLIDDAGAVRVTLTLDKYRQAGGVVWPAKIVARSAEGTVTVLLDDLEINTDLPANVFRPPARAARIP